MIPMGGESVLIAQRFVDYRERRFWVDGQSYWVRWYICEQHTFCSVSSRNARGKPFCVGGLAVRKPGDAFSAREGMVASARRACGIGEQWPPHRMPELYAEIRGWLRKESSHTRRLLAAQDGIPVPEPVLTEPRQLEVKHAAVQDERLLVTLGPKGMPAQVAS